MVNDGCIEEFKPDRHQTISIDTKTFKDDKIVFDCISVDYSNRITESKKTVSIKTDKSID